MINSKKTQVAPSLLSANFGNLEKDIEMLNQSEADFIHLDIMDGVFVPNISFGFPVLEYVNRLSKKPLDAHLMVVDPGKFVNEVKKIGAEIMTVHYEACTHLDRTIHQIKEAGMKAGVSLNPHTPVDLLENIINDIDLVLIMSVNPGYGNQKFIPYALDKVRALRELIDRKGAKTVIEVDGGVNLETGKLLVEAGADILVAGSFVFNSANPTETISALSKL
ncbi:MAG: ribulose-phosphate 3-epimerase [Bacteroidales bacterium]